MRAARAHCLLLRRRLEDARHRPRTTGRQRPASLPLVQVRQGGLLSYRPGLVHCGKRAGRALSRGAQRHSGLPRRREEEAGPLRLCQARSVPIDHSEFSIHD